MGEASKKSKRKLVFGCLGSFLLFSALIASAIFFSFQKCKESFSGNQVDSEKLARSIMDYEFPEPATIPYKMDIFGVKMVLIQTEQFPPNLTLTLNSVPTDMANQPQNRTRVNAGPGMLSNDPNFFIKSRVKERAKLCDTPVELIIIKGHLERDKLKTRAIIYQTNVIHNSRYIAVTLTGMGKQRVKRVKTLFKTLKCK